MLFIGFAIGIISDNIISVIVIFVIELGTRLAIFVKTQKHIVLIFHLRVYHLKRELKHCSIQ